MSRKDLITAGALQVLILALWTMIVPPPSLGFALGERSTTGGRTDLLPYCQVARGVPEAVRETPASPCALGEPAGNDGRAALWGLLEDMRLTCAELEGDRSLLGNSIAAWDFAEETRQ